MMLTLMADLGVGGALLPLLIFTLMTIVGVGGARLPVLLGCGLAAINYHGYPKGRWRILAFFRLFFVVVLMFAVMAIVWGRRRTFASLYVDCGLADDSHAHGRPRGRMRIPFQSLFAYVHAHDHRRSK